MLETSHERINLLKAGFTQRKIEEMYIEGNGFRIVYLPIQVDLVEIETGPNKHICETAVESAQSLGLAMVGIFNVPQSRNLSPSIQ